MATPRDELATPRDEMNSPGSLGIIMRYLVLLPLLLAACETFSGAETSETQNQYITCNVPIRLMVLRTFPEYCRGLGGHRVDDDRMDELESYYQGLNSS